MKPSSQLKTREDIGLGIVLVLCIFLAPILFGLWVFNRDRRECVERAYGLYLGYALVFDFGKDPISVGGTIKFANGEPLVDHDVWTVFVSDTSAFGYAIAGESSIDFAWRADTGVVLSRDDPETHDRIVAAAGPLNYGADSSTGNADWPSGGDSDTPARQSTDYGPIVLMTILADMPQFDIQTCRTRLFNW